MPEAISTFIFSADRWNKRYLSLSPGIAVIPQLRIRSICRLECLRFDCGGILQRNPVAENGLLIHVYLIPETRSEGPYFYSVYTRFWLCYICVIRLSAADNALYLSVPFLFQICHPPLCIPWKEIKIGRTKFLWRQFIVFMLG